MELNVDPRAEDRARHWYSAHLGALALPSKGCDSSCVSLTLFFLSGPFCHTAESYYCLHVSLPSVFPSFSTGGGAIGDLAKQGLTGCVLGRRVDLDIAIQRCLFYLWGYGFRQALETENLSPHPFYTLSFPSLCCPIAVEGLVEQNQGWVLHCVPHQSENVVPFTILLAAQYQNTSVCSVTFACYLPEAVRVKVTYLRGGSIVSRKLFSLLWGNVHINLSWLCAGEHCILLSGVKRGSH